MNKENNFVRLLIILLIALFAGFSLYWLPDSIYGHKLKKVDLLSDIRIKPVALSLDSLMKQLEEEARQDSIAHAGEGVDSTSVDLLMDSTALALRDSLYRTMYAASGADSTGTRIEDYSAGHAGLARFFSALKNRKTLNRPVRIAFLGDSFIEGDIIVADLRSSFQKQFGGNGVGFVPVLSVTDQFRPTINQKATGWESHNMLADTTRGFTLSGVSFEPSEGAKLTLKPADKYPDLANVPSLKIYYMSENDGTVSYITEDTTVYELPERRQPGLAEINKPFAGVTLAFSGEEGTTVFGTALEENTGVVVDNFSLRGNSGLILSKLDVELCNRFAEVRPYDLILLQYGLNVVSEEMLNYGWYRERMIHVVRHVQACFPGVDLLLLGVSDRGYQSGDSFETMPAVLALLHSQRQIANRTGITFWNTFGAMGGINSMVRFVDNNWAGKDYTHLSFRGGREIAKLLYNAFLLEKEFYDEADKSIHK